MVYVPGALVDGVMTPLASILMVKGAATNQTEAPVPPAPVITGDTVPAVPVHMEEGEYAIVPLPALSMVTLVVVV